MQKIIFDCERMKIPFTGLYTYCYYLGNALKRNIKTSNEKLDFYIPPNSVGIFGEDQHYVIKKWWHKMTMPFASAYDLWHCTYQSTNYFPPRNKLKIIL